MRRAAGVAIVALTGCHQLFGLQEVEYDAPPSEAGVDARPDALEVAGCSTMASLADDFNDGVVGRQWEVSPEITEAQGYLQFSVSPGSSRALRSAWYHDLRERAFSLQVIPQLQLGANDSISLRIETDRSDAYLLVEARGTQLRWSRVEGGTTNALGQTMYEAAIHRYWRVRRAGTTTYIETSSNGTEFSSLSSIDLPAMTFARAALFVGAGGASPVSVWIDNVNDGVATPDACPIGILDDELSGPELDARWRRTAVYAGTLTLDGNDAQARSTDDGLNVWLLPRTVHDMTNRAFAIELPRVEIPAAGSYVNLSVRTLTSGIATLQVEGSRVRGYWSTDTGTPSVVDQEYDPAAHRWLRLRHAGSTLYWEGSADGTQFETLGQFGGVSGLDQVDVQTRFFAPPGTTAAVDLATVRTY